MTGSNNSLRDRIDRFRALDSGMAEVAGLDARAQAFSGELATLLRAAREAQGLELPEMSARLQASPDTIRAIEEGEAPLGAHTLACYLDALGRDPAEVLDCLHAQLGVARP